jgi:signal transduction histidine kinase
VDAHFDALERAVRNLLVNAMEAQEGGGRVELSASARDGVVSITVSDGGPGIPDDMIEDVWRPDITTKRHGTGLGLAIVHQTVAAHGGSVEARNLPTGGAAFTLNLPEQS